MRVFAFGAILVGLGLLLCGCEHPDASVPLAPAKIRRTMLRDVIPKSTFVCAAEPDGSNVETAIAGAEYIADLRAAGRDCRRKLKAVKTLIETESE